VAAVRNCQACGWFWMSSLTTDLFAVRLHFHFYDVHFYDVLTLLRNPKNILTGVGGDEGSLNAFLPRRPVNEVAATGKKTGAFTGEERAAMREHVQELKAEARGGPADTKDGESAVLAKFAALPQPDRSIGGRLHTIIKANAPSLSPKTWPAQMGAAPV
jgi:hypothetical protein